MVGESSEVLWQQRKSMGTCREGCLMERAAGRQARSLKQCRKDVGRHRKPRTKLWDESQRCLLLFCCPECEGEPRMKGDKRVDENRQVTVVRNAHPGIETLRQDGGDQIKSDSEVMDMGGSS